MEAELEEFDRNNYAWTDYQSKLSSKIDDLKDEIAYLYADIDELKRQLKRSEIPLTAFD